MNEITELVANGFRTSKPGNKLMVDAWYRAVVAVGDELGDHFSWNQDQFDLFLRKAGAIT